MYKKKYQIRKTDIDDSHNSNNFVLKTYAILLQNCIFLKQSSGFRESRCHYRGSGFSHGCNHNRSFQL